MMNSVERSEWIQNENILRQSWLKTFSRAASGTPRSFAASISLMINLRLDSMPLESSRIDRKLGITNDFPFRFVVLKLYRQFMKV